MSEEKFRTSNTAKTDEELIEIFVNKSAYREEVTLIVETELRNRKIDDQVFQKKCTEISKRVRADQKRIEDLSGKEKIIVFFGIFIFIIRFLGFNKFPLVSKAIDYVNAGFERKAQKVVLYKTISIFFWAFFLLMSWVSIDFYLAEQRRIEHENKKSANLAFEWDGKRLCAFLNHQNKLKSKVIIVLPG